MSTQTLTPTELRILAAAHGVAFEYGLEVDDGGLRDDSGVVWSVGEWSAVTASRLGWSEDDHPRDESGRFSSDGGGGAPDAVGPTGPSSRAEIETIGGGVRARTAVQRELDAQGVAELAPIRGVVDHASDRLSLARNRDGAIVGALAWNRSRDLGVHLADFRVTDRGQGTGTAMLIEVAKEATTTKSGEIRVSGAVPGAVPFYQSTGAVFAGERRGDALSFGSFGTWDREATQALAEGRPIDKRESVEAAYIRRQLESGNPNPELPGGRTATAEWDEDEHPRGEGGKFVEKGDEAEPERYIKVGDELINEQTGEELQPATGKTIPFPKSQAEYEAMVQDPRDHTRTMDGSPITADTPLLVFHATTREHAGDLQKYGAVPSAKPGSLAQQRFEAGEYAEFAPGAGLERGLYVAGHPNDASGYGRDMVAVTVRAGDLATPAESTVPGGDPVEALGDGNGAIITVPVPPENIAPYGTKPGYIPQAEYGELRARTADVDYIQGEGGRFEGSRARGGDKAKYVEAARVVEDAPSVKRGFEPDFASERHRFEPTGPPDGYTTEERADETNVGGYDHDGNLVSTFSVATTGPAEGAFKVSVRPDAMREGYGSNLLAEVERQGIVDLADVAAQNRYTREGRALLMSYFERKATRASSVRLADVDYIQGEDGRFQGSRARGGAKTFEEAAAALDKQIAGSRDEKLAEAERLFAKDRARLNEAFPRAVIELAHHPDLLPGGRPVEVQTGAVDGLVEMAGKYPAAAAQVGTIEIGSLNIADPSALGMFTPTGGARGLSRIEIDTLRTAQSQGPANFSTIATAREASTVEAGEAVAVHEFGHALDYANSASGFENGKEAFAIAKENISSGRSFAPHISAYSMKNEAEYFAEAFTAHELGMGDRLTEADKLMLSNAGVKVEVDYQALQSEAARAAAVDDDTIVDDFDGSIVWQRPKNTTPRTASWNEEDHPRDERGRFGEKGGDEGSSSKAEPKAELTVEGPTTHVYRGINVALDDSVRAELDDALTPTDPDKYEAGGYEIQKQEIGERILAQLAGYESPLGEGYHGIGQHWSTSERIAEIATPNEQGKIGIRIEANVPDSARIAPRGTHEEIWADTEEEVRVQEGAAIEVTQVWVNWSPLASEYTPLLKEPVVLQTRPPGEFLASVAWLGAEWDEEDHPRGEGGRFVEKGDEGSSGRDEPAKAKDDPARELNDRVRRAEPGVSADMRDIVAGLGGKLNGYEFRMKTPDSLGRKVADKMREGMTREQAFASVKDALRYTMEFDHENYTEGTVAALTELGHLGYEVREIKNYWEPGDTYSGINAVLQQGDVTLELQFHTPESWETKFGENEKLYHEYRQADTSQERRAELYQQMTGAWDEVPIPRAIESFGTPVFMENA